MRTHDPRGSVLLMGNCRVQPVRLRPHLLHGCLDNVVNEQSTSPPVPHLHALLTSGDEPPTQTDIFDLLKASYEKFSSLRASDIEQMWFKQRLKVIQSLEDTAKRSVVRAIPGDTGFSIEELEDLYMVFKLPASGLGKAVKDGPRPWDPAATWETWKRLLAPAFRSAYLQPGNQWMENLLLPFLLSGGMYHGDMTEKLKVLYKLHLPPEALPQEDREGSRSEDTQEKRAEEKGTSPPDYRHYLRMWAKEREAQKETIKDLPQMNQEQFIELCKTLYNKFSEDPLEQDLYHAIATVAGQPPHQ